MSGLVLAYLLFVTSTQAEEPIITEEATTVYLMTCANMYLKGQFGYLQARTKENLTEVEKASMLVLYTQCEEVSRAFRNEMK